MNVAKPYGHIALGSYPELNGTVTCKSTPHPEISGNKTKITIVFDAETQNSVELQRNGWQAILDNFKKYVESN